ncbi:MAG: RnfABCDGE type electron transport complex subunit C [Erysipelotrichaceae bacterium]
MSLLMSEMKKHINTYKELTKDKDIKEIKTLDFVNIPLINMTSTNYELDVQIGDKVKIGTQIGHRNDHFYVPFFSSVSGEVVEVKKIMHSSLKPVDHLVIKNDFKEEKAYLPAIDINSATRSELLDFTKNAGIVGCGGAGLPSYIKFSSENNHTLIINAVECEPYITADDFNIKHHQDLFILGLKAVLKMTNVEKVILTFKDYKKGQDKTKLRSLLDDVKDIVNTEVRFVENAYPMGWERSLVFGVTHKRYDRLPTELGLIVSNITTIIALGDAMMNRLPIVDKIVTFAGDGIKENTNVLVKVGVSVKNVIENLGGYTAEEIKLIAGGPMMGKTILKDEFVITPYTNGITILKNNNIESINCLHCGRCIDHCPSGLQPVLIVNAGKVKDHTLLEKLNVSDCIECGLCTYVCPSRIKVTEGIRVAKRAAKSV